MGNSPSALQTLRTICSEESLTREQLLDMAVQLALPVDYDYIRHWEDFETVFHEKKQSECPMHCCAPPTPANFQSLVRKLICRNQKTGNLRTLVETAIFLIRSSVSDEKKGSVCRSLVIFLKHILMYLPEPLAFHLEIAPVVDPPLEDEDPEVDESGNPYETKVESISWHDLSSGRKLGETGVGLPDQITFLAILETASAESRNCLDINPRNCCFYIYGLLNSSLTTVVESETLGQQEDANRDFLPPNRFVTFSKLPIAISAGARKIGVFCNKLSENGGVVSRLLDSIADYLMSTAWGALSPTSIDISPTIDSNGKPLSGTSNQMHEKKSSDARHPLRNVRVSVKTLELQRALFDLQLTLVQHNDYLSIRQNSWLSMCWNKQGGNRQIFELEEKDRNQKDYNSSIGLLPSGRGATKNSTIAIDPKTISPGQRPILEMSISKFARSRPKAISWFTTLLNYIWSSSFSKRVVDGSLVRNEEAIQVSREDLEKAYRISQHLQRSAMHLTCLYLWGTCNYSGTTSCNSQESPCNFFLTKVLPLLCEKMEIIESTTNSTSASSASSAVGDETETSSSMDNPTDNHTTNHTMDNHANNHTSSMDNPTNNHTSSMDNHGNNSVIGAKSEVEISELFTSLYSPAPIQWVPLFLMLCKCLESEGKNGSRVSKSTSAAALMLLYSLTYHCPNFFKFIKTKITCTNLIFPLFRHICRLSPNNPESIKFYREIRNTYLEESMKKESDDDQHQQLLRVENDLQVPRPPPSMALSFCLLLHIFVGDDNLQWKVLRDMNNHVNSNHVNTNQGGDSCSMMMEDSCSSDRGCKSCIVAFKDKLQNNWISSVEDSILETGLDCKKVGITSNYTNPQSILLFCILRLIQWNFGTFKDQFLQEVCFSFLSTLKLHNLQFWVCQRVLQMLFQCEKSLPSSVGNSSMTKKSTIITRSNHVVKTNLPGVNDNNLVDTNDASATEIFVNLQKIIVNALRPMGVPDINNSSNSNVYNNIRGAAYQNSCGPMAYSVLRESERLKNLCIRNHSFPLSPLILRIIDHLAHQFAVQISGADLLKNSGNYSPNNSSNTTKSTSTTSVVDPLQQEFEDLCDSLNFDQLCIVCEDATANIDWEKLLSSTSPSNIAASTSTKPVDQNNYLANDETANSKSIRTTPETYNAILDTYCVYKEDLSSCKPFFMKSCWNDLYNSMPRGLCWR